MSLTPLQLAYRVRDFSGCEGSDSGGDTGIGTDIGIGTGIGLDLG
ncbi:hypothetical protein [Streptomyces gibsoniae]|uniref:Sulfate adenylyltransferase n=1 Tax=Streptomyces gibsoniae TaxID=3075529 RepID=A0ABU2TS20_9ACTN|nr:hypothetical protein [Streptomyces sp. DSM 41699]MDT0463759.1 hypothetical protein [Streptomyces sp. DSM 41699]